MSLPRAPEPAVLVFGALLAPEVPREDVLSALSETFGPVRTAGPEGPFNQSAYYGREMGLGLRRFFLAVEGVFDPGDLAGLKHRSNALEARWADGGLRRVNLDPGLLDLTHLVLATGKPAAHRVYLARGIYAEIEYTYERGSFQPLPWTYLDYREPAAVEFFNGLREARRLELRGAKSKAAGQAPPDNGPLTKDEAR